MPQVEFIGDWQPEEVERASDALKKSLSGEPGGGAEVTIPQIGDNPIQTMLSKRQKRLIELLRQAGSAALHGPELQKSAAESTDVDSEEHVCGPNCDHSWLGYGSLEKAAVGEIKRDAKGRAYRFSAKSRWERFDPGAGGGGVVDPGQFRFSPVDGPFGRGVYFPVAAGPSGAMRIRLGLHLSPNAMITADDFHSMESDFAQDLELMLERQGVRAVAQVEQGKVTLLCIRSVGDIEVLGAVAGSGALPPGGDWEYHLVSLTPQDDHFTADVEVVARGGALNLQKAAITSTSKVFQGGALAGSPVVPNGKPAIDRQLLRRAVERCRADGVPVGDVSIRLVEGAPDFLGMTRYAFCLPGENTVYLMNHDPSEALNRQVKMLTARLRRGVEAGAIAADEALDLMQIASGMDEEWWLESLLKRHIGALLCARVGCVMSTEAEGWRGYINLLAGRGLEFWGDRRSIAEAMAEDYRCAFDPAGLPNRVTIFWDVACPELARLCQQKLLSALSIESKSKKQDPEVFVSRHPYFASIIEQ